MSKVLVDRLRIRTAPSVKASVIGYYDRGSIIRSGDLLLSDGFHIWLRYHAAGGGLRYVCAREHPECPKFYVDYPNNLPWQNIA